MATHAAVRVLAFTSLCVLSTTAITLEEQAIFNFKFGQNKNAARRSPAAAASVQQGAPPTRSERLQQAAKRLSLQSLVSEGNDIEHVLRSKVVDSPIFKTKISWECRQAVDKKQRDKCQWTKATNLMCKLIPEAATKLAKVEDLEKAMGTLLDSVDVEETAAGMMLLQVNYTEELDKDHVFDDVGNSAAAEVQEAMFQRVTSSKAFDMKVKETCFGIEKTAGCETKAKEGVYCTLLLQAAVAVAEVDDIASMMTGKMELHFDEIKLPEVNLEASTTRKPFF